MHKFTRSKTNQYLQTLWDAISEAFIDPIFFGFGLYMLFSRIQTMFYNGSTPNEVWELFLIDMENNVILYTIFAFIFLLWAYAKSQKYHQQKEYSKKLDSILTELKGIKEVLIKNNNGVKNERDKM